MIKTNATKNKVAEIVTAKILKALENGTVPWSRPWVSGLQRSFVSHKRYSGINQWVLQLEAEEKGYTSNQWLSFNEAIKHGDVTGQQSVPVVFFTTFEPKDTKTDKQKEEERQVFRVLRYYRVFNACQVKGLKFTEQKDKTLEKLPTPEAICASYLTREHIEYSEGGDKAYYSPSSDAIKLPVVNNFKSIEARYATLFHEMTHSTGHKSRLDRFNKDTPAVFGSVDYSKEELVAELGSSMLCHVLGIDPDIDQSASYIASWLRALKNDKSLLVSASSRADKAVSYITGGAI